MEIEPLGATLKGPADRFTGDVYNTPISAPEAPSFLSAGIVRFAPGAHTNWHVHPNGQVLHVLDGIALVGTRDGAVVTARAGDTVRCAPGVDHWHGATTETYMVHIAMVVGSADHPGTDWQEPVDDLSYRRAQPTSAES